LVLTLVAVGLVALGCTLAVPRMPFGPSMLVASATATSLALTVTALLAGGVVGRVAGGVVSWATLLRSGLALALVVGVGNHLPWSGPIGTLAEAAAVALLGVAALIALGELGRADLDRVRRIVGTGRR
jgi:stage V sporulation protein B